MSRSSPHRRPVTDHSDGRSYRQLLSDRVFGPFFFSNSLSNIGNWFQNVAAGIVVFRLTGSNAAVGVVSMLQFGSTMLFTPFAGGVSDRVDRRKMLFVGQFIAFLGALSLATTVIVVGVDGLPGPWPIYAATAVLGVGAAIILPSLQAVVPAFVERDDLERAITLNSLTFNIARAVGPVLGGVTVAVLGATWAFGINTLSFVPLLVVLAWIRPRGKVSPDKGAAEVKVMDGVRWAARRRTVVVLLVATLAVGWTSDPFNTLMPALAEDLGGGDASVGLLVGAFGAGAAIMVGFSDRVRRRVGRGRVTGLGLGLAAAGLLVMAGAPVLAIALAGAAVSGGGFLLGVTSTNTELQRGIPDHLRGRLMALWSVAFLGCRPVAAGVDGVVADLTSVRTALVLSAALGALAAVAMWRIRPTSDQIEGDAPRDEADPDRPTEPQPLEPSP